MSTNSTPSARAPSASRRRSVLRLVDRDHHRLAAVQPGFDEGEGAVEEPLHVKVEERLVSKALAHDA